MSKDNNNSKRCTHTTRVSPHPSVVIGGVCVGHCENECFPGLTVCFDHASKDTLALLARSILRDYEKATGAPHPYLQTPIYRNKPNNRRSNQGT